MRLLYFAMIREKLHKSQEDIDFQGTVSELREFLIKRHPEMEGLFRVVRFAVNEEYVSEDYLLRGDERVAIIPPVSGG